MARTFSDEEITVVRGGFLIGAMMLTFAAGWIIDGIIGSIAAVGGFVMIASFIIDRHHRKEKARDEATKAD